MNRLRRLIAAASLLTPLILSAQTPGLRVDESAVRFSFSSDHFLAELPIANTGSPASVQVVVELLDTQNAVRGHGTATCSLRTATTVCGVALPPAVRPDSGKARNGDSLCLFRVRYTVTPVSQPAISGTLALDHIAPALFVLHIATPKEIRPGGTYAIRIRATHPLTLSPQPGVPLEATATASIDGVDKDAVLERKHLVTDRNGFATLEFTAPSNPALDSVSILVDGRLTNIHSTVEQHISVPSQRSLTLTTDKPLYQPGQTVHLRLLSIDNRGRALAKSKLTLDVRDPDNTLVFRTEATTSHFGIASADWTVPARLRLGNYTIATSDEGNSPSASAQIRISRYDLPTFVVVPKPDKPFYLPGQNAAVEVRADYLFGKPVVHGHVRVVRETDRQWNFEKQKYDTEEGAVYTGELGGDGSFTAHVDLSADEKDFADPDISTGNFTDLHLAAYVTDSSTGRTEQRRFDLRVSARPLHVSFIENARAAAGLATSGFLSVTTADGLPAANATLQISLLPMASGDPEETLGKRAAHAVALTRVTTNSYGIARVDNLPPYEGLVKRMPAPLHAIVEAEYENTPGEPELLLSARTPDGQTGRSVHRLSKPSGLLRVDTDHTLYKPADPIRITVTSAQPSLPIHLQLLRTAHSGFVSLATENLTLHNGRATLTISSGTPDAPDPRFTGYLTVSVVALASGHKIRTPWGSENDIEATSSRTVLFPRDNSLHVDVKVEHATYRPGETASANVDVKGPQDQDGDDTSLARTALGIVAVDQAVNERNRSDNEFGNGNSFFFPWRPLFVNSQQVPGLTLADIEQRDPAKPFTPELDLAATLLLNVEHLGIELTDNTPHQQISIVFAGMLEMQIGPVRNALRSYLTTHTSIPTTVSGLDDLLAAQKLSVSALRDPWDKPFHLVASPNYTIMSLDLVSDGPDKQPGTSDDFRESLAQWNWFAHYESDLRRVLIDDHLRTKAYIRDLSALTAAMQADHIDFASWRDPWGQPFTWKFTVQQADFAVTAVSQGHPPSKDQPRHSAFEAGSASISWFTDDRLLIQNALTTYAATRTFPRTASELETALRASGLSLAKLVDPWGHPLEANFRTRTIFTDRVSVEARAHAGTTPQKHTTVTPVTAIIDTIDLGSLGPDGKRGKQGDNTFADDFTVASFSHERAQQSAKESSPQKPRSATQSGEPTIETGSIVGTVSDPTGAVIPNVAIVATNAATQAEFETTTDATGEYMLTPLPAGLYTVRFKMPGFQTTVIDQVHVLSPDATVLDAKLQVGAATETIAVTAQTVTLSTESSSISGVAGMAGGFLGGRLANSRSRVMFADMKMPAPPPPPSGTPRIRDYFPETLLWRPEVLTAADGTATSRFPVADNITTWQLSVAASTLGGNTGAGIASFQTFLPFFAALDPPQVLTTGDRIALPITLRNYLDHRVKVHNELTAAPWLRIDTPPATITIPAQDSASPTATITPISPILSGKILFTARPEGDTGDSIERPITVHPDGLEAAVTTAGIVNGPTTFTLTIPADAMPGSSDATLKLYPNLSAHLRDALVAMTAYPDGCAEQIISIAWPSLLLQRYAAMLPAPDKKLVQQTRLNLAAAYANLLADRDSSGGFRYWPNDKQPDLALTAYAIQFLTAAREFTAIDDGVIKSAVAYLAQHQAAGLWMRIDRDNKPHPEDTAGNAMLTASIAAMIAGAPDADPLTAKALAATQSFTASIDEPYTLANYALAAISAGDTARSKPAIARLQTLALSENGGAYWNLETNTPFFGWGRAGRVETTAAALRALLASGMKSNDDLITRGLLFLDHQQDRQSLWYSTQATARTLDVLASIALGSFTPNESSRPNPERAKHVERAVERPAAKSSTIVVRIDGNPIATAALPPPDKDAGPLFIPLGAALTAGPHKITLDLPTGSSPATAQIVANFYHPWPGTTPTSATTNNEQLRLSVAFDNKSAAPNTPIHAIAHIERLGFRGYGMLIAEIGLPPGADVDRASLEAAVEDSGYTLNHYEVLPDKLLLYLWPDASGYDLHFTFSLRYAIDALTAPSAVYDYYNPDPRLDLPPQRFVSGVAF